MNVYTLSEFGFMRYDLEHVFDEIGRLFDVVVRPNGLECTSLLRLPEGVHWATGQSHEHFNRAVPRYKSLHMAMYSVLEAVAVHELKKASVRAAFEWMDPLFTPFRHLNNQFKHHVIRGIPMDLVEVVYLHGKEAKFMEVACNVEGRCINYSRFVIMFLTLLQKAGVIEFENRG